MVKKIIVFLIRILMSIMLVSFILHYLFQDKINGVWANGITCVCVAVVWWGTEIIIKKISKKYNHLT